MAEIKVAWMWWGFISEGRGTSQWKVGPGKVPREAAEDFTSLPLEGAQSS